MKNIPTAWRATLVSALVGTALLLPASLSPPMANCVPLPGRTEFLRIENDKVTVPPIETAKTVLTWISGKPAADKQKTKAGPGQSLNQSIVSFKQQQNLRLRASNLPAKKQPVRLKSRCSSKHKLCVTPVTADRSLLK